MPFAYGPSWRRVASSPPPALAHRSKCRCFGDGHPDRIEQLATATGKPKGPTPIPIAVALVSPPAVQFNAFFPALRCAPRREEPSSFCVDERRSPIILVRIVVGTFSTALRPEGKYRRTHDRNAPHAVGRGQDRHRALGWPRESCCHTLIARSKPCDHTAAIAVVAAAPHQAPTVPPPQTGCLRSWMGSDYAEQITSAMAQGSRVDAPTQHSCEVCIARRGRQSSPGSCPAARTASEPRPRRRRPPLRPCPAKTAAAIVSRTGGLEEVCALREGRGR